MLSLKERARLVYLDEERKRDHDFADRVLIHDHNYNPGTLMPDGTSSGVMGSQFDYLWNFYQGFKRTQPYAARLTVMARWERKAFWKFWLS